MRLVEAGKLDLDTPIKTYIDWLHLSDPDATEHITLRMLLSHTSGLPTDGQHFGLRDPQGLEASIREQLPTYTPVAPYNTVLSYSNPGLNLAGYVAEKVSGKHYATLMQELVFDPLQMQRTTFDPTIAMTYPLAQSHALDKNGTLHVQHQYADNIAHYPSGFAISTVMDLTNFAIMHMQQGTFQGQSILTPESVQEMHKAQALLYTLEDAAYGLTFFLKTYKGKQYLWHDGGISTFGSRLALLPETGTAVIMTFNRWLPTVDIVTEGIFDQLLLLPEQQAGPESIEPDRTLWSNYTGSYLGQWRGLTKIEVTNDHLILRQNDTIIPLHAVRNDLYVGHAENEKMLISVGFPAALESTQYIYVNSFVHTRAKLTTAPDQHRWKDFEGTYALEGLDTYTISVVEDELHLYSKTDNLEITLTPVDATRFGCRWGLFEFLLNEENSVFAVKQGPTWIYQRVSS
jgi:CubicO group peptidase (beta-lactamase class C family)